MESGGECMKRMIMTLKKKETLKLLGMLLAFGGFVWFNMVSVGGISGYDKFMDQSTLMLMILFTVAVLWLSGVGKDFLNGLQLAFTEQKNYSRIKVQRACNAIKYTRTLIFMEAVFMIFICLVDILYQVDCADMNTLFPSLAVTILSVLYAFMAAVFLTILSAKLENMLASYMEEPQAEISVDEAQTLYFKLRALGLTDREAEVARLVSCDMTNREIAQMLYISEATVKKHITHILEKTAMADREELTKRIRVL